MPHAVLCVGSNTEGYDDIPAWRDQWTGGVYGGLGVSRWNVTSRPDAFWSRYWLCGCDATRPGPAIGVADPGLAAL